MASPTERLSTFTGTALFVVTFAASLAHAADSACMAAAKEKKLAAAAQKSLVKKCEADAKAKCEAAASEKKLAGAAKNSNVRKCVMETGPSAWSTADLQTRLFRGKAP
jgi:hypothetical protein